MISKYDSKFTCIFLDDATEYIKNMGGEVEFIVNDTKIDSKLQVENNVYWFKQKRAQ